MDAKWYKELEKQMMDHYQKWHEGIEGNKWVKAIE